jgi:DNA (cytosine-5)-methyltransferase 1
VVSKQNTGLVIPYLVQCDHIGGNGSYIRSLKSPLPTIVTTSTIGLVEPIIKAIEDGDVDPKRLVFIDGDLYYLDILFRMLENDELSRAMGFEYAEYKYEFVGNKSQVTKQIGNAVPVHLAKCLVRAIFSRN